jgi:type IV pilus assembly protein PilC
MPSYAYTALDARGQEVSDTLEAGNENEAIAALRQAGYYPTSVVEAGKAAKAARGKTAKAPKAKATGLKKEINISIPFLERKTIKPKTLMIFTRQLATLIDSGLPLLRGLNVLGKQEPDPVLRKTIGKLADSVQGGSTFSDGLAQHPKIFNKLYINMVKAGSTRSSCWSSRWPSWPSCSSTLCPNSSRSLPTCSGASLCPRSPNSSSAPAAFSKTSGI